MSYGAMSYRAMKDNWSEADRVVMDSILDQLIPANPDRAIPGAGELGVADYLAQVALDNASLSSALKEILKRMSTLTGNVTTDDVRRLESDCPAEFELLVTETYKGYYSRPDMRAKVGVGAHPVHPNGYAVDPEPAELLRKLTTPVRTRGACYRDSLPSRKA